MRGRWVVWLLVTAAVAHCAWVLEFWLNTGLDARHAFVSELSSRGAPYAWLYRAADAVAGPATFAAAFWWPLTGRTGCAGGRWARIGWIALAVDGLAVASNAVLPLDCTTSAPACRRREELGHVSVTHHGHQAASLVASAALLLMIAAFAMAARRDQAPAVLAVWGLPLLAVVGAASVTITILYLTHRWMGLPQRIQLIGLSAWLAVLARACVHWPAPRRAMART
jgi:hypothetical protein